MHDEIIAPGRYAMRRLVISINPKGTSLLFEGDSVDAAEWGIMGDTVQLFGHDGLPCAAGLLGVLGALYLPQHENIKVSSISATGERCSKNLPRRRQGDMPDVGSVSRISLPFAESVRM